LAVARLLVLSGHAAEVLFIGDQARCSEETRQQLAIAKNYGLRIHDDPSRAFYPADRSSDEDTAQKPDLVDAPSDDDLSQELDPGGRRWNSIVDALFGIGLTRPVEGQYAAAIRAINHWRNTQKSSPAPHYALHPAAASSSEPSGNSPVGIGVIALDIPSGISADTGQILGVAVKADITVTFAFNKYGLTLPPGNTYAGRIFVKDIGIYEKIP
jgi:NAD(P)H-hydrate epimerase